MSHVLIGIGGEDGFEVLAPQDAVDLEPGGPESQPWVTVIRDWSYFVGNQPRGKTSKVIGGAQATKFVIQILPADEGEAERHRVILLGGGPVNVTRLDGTDSHAMDNPPQYIDAWLDESGEVDHIDDAAPFDPSTTPGSEGLITTIQKACEANGVDPP